MVTWANVSEVARRIGNDISDATNNYFNHLGNQGKIQKLIQDKTENELRKIVYDNTFSFDLNLMFISNDELWKIVKKHCF
jgi:hypothetical protein